MENITNPSVIKHNFITTLNQTALTTFGAERLLNYFCEIVWELEEEQQDCYERLAHFMFSLPEICKIALIPKLINTSKDYPNLVLLAETLFNTLGRGAQKCIEIPMIFWTIDSQYTSISQKEYLYLLRHGKQAWIKNGDYRRPMQMFDLICFERVLDMIIVSQSKTLIFI